MKKSIIAAGAASVALAAMPIVGAFAASTSVKDAITMTVQDGCTVTADAERAVSISVVAGSSNTADGTAISISCSSANWTMTAVGSGTSGQTTSLYNGAAAIESAGTFASGQSDWGFKINALATNANAEIQPGYDDYTAVPATAADVVKGKTAAGTVSVTPSYKVQLSSTQDTSANYNGGVTYTIGPNA